MSIDEYFIGYFSYLKSSIILCCSDYSVDHIGFSAEEILLFLTLSEAAYDLVVDYDDFWTRYGFCPAPFATGLPGWLSIDELNLKSDIWIPVFHRNLQSSAIEAIQAVQTQLTPAAENLISIPFIAWIISDLIVEEQVPTELFNLNYLDFVKRFWKEHIKKMKPDLKRLGHSGIQAELEKSKAKILNRF